ncbi:MAG: Rad52/Rad22 family DNA repair protein [Acidobacteriota bacterium]
MSAAIKSLPARTKRAKLIAAMGLVSREDNGFHVKSPSRNKEISRVWRDDKGRVRCSCSEFEEQWQEDMHFRCEHILAVKFHLEPPTEDPAMQRVPMQEETEEDETPKPVTTKAATPIKIEPATVESTVEVAAENSPTEQFPNVLKQLSTPIPRDLVRQRVGWTDSSGIEHEIDYIEWHTVADLLDRIYPEWSHTVKDIRHIGDLVAVTTSITIMGVTREGIGTGSAYDEKGIKKAEHDALKRAAVKFGIARELYKKDDDDDNNNTTQPVVRFPRDPVAKNVADTATAKQLAAIRAIANAQGIDAQAECFELLNCRPEELSRRAASAFIDHLKTRQVGEVRRVS